MVRVPACNALLRPAFARITIAAAAPVAAALAVTATLAALTATGAQALPYDIGQAQQRAAEASGSVQGNALEVRARQTQSEAIRRLGGPTVTLSGLAARASTSFSVDTSGVAGQVNPLLGGIGSRIGVTLPTLSSGYDFDRTTTLTSASLTALWPVYTGGRIDAIKDLVRARAREAEADQADGDGRHATEVTERYFTVQLAREALALREEVTAGMTGHARAAGLLESKGLIARSERLRADVALANARQEQARARNDLELAEVALRRLLDVADPVEATTPLFVHSESVGTLQSFIDSGLARHPAWSRLASKADQADASLRLQGQRWTPTVAALGSYSHPVGGHSGMGNSWIIGLQVSVPLIGAIDHERMRAAARLEQQRVDLGREQAGRDIPTLIESQWRAMENARLAFLAAGPAIELAQENLRLSRIAFAESQATVLDVTDAQLNLARTQIERSQNAYDYVLALARLLQASGESRRIASLATQADIVLRQSSPSPR